MIYSSAPLNITNIKPWTEKSLTLLSYLGQWSPSHHHGTASVTQRRSRQAESVARQTLKEGWFYEAEELIDLWFVIPNNVWLTQKHRNLFSLEWQHRLHICITASWLSLWRARGSLHSAVWLILLFVAPYHWGPVARMAGQYLGHVVVYVEREIVLLMFCCSRSSQQSLQS